VLENSWYVEKLFLCPFVSPKNIDELGEVLQLLS
jgi:hypothetical protein